MKVKINHIELLLDDKATLQDALDKKNIPATGIATAVNGTVIPATARRTHTLSDGDDIVVIKAFYGG